MRRWPPTTRTAGRRKGAPGLSYLNEGVRLAAIALWLESAEANTPALRAQSARLRTIFRDLDYRVGFFGALGHRAARRTSAELVVDAYNGTSMQHLDLGFWNLETVQDQFARHLPDLGWVLAGMGLDVWCLAHVEPENLQALCEHLDVHFQLAYQAVVAPGQGTEPPLALLVRSARPARAEWLAAAPDDDLSRALIQVPGGRAARILLVPVLQRRGSPPRGVLEAALHHRHGGTQADVLALGDGLVARDLPRWPASAVISVWPWAATAASR